MKNNRKKKRFKLIKVKRKPEVKKENPFAQALIEHLIKEFALTEKQAKANTFAIIARHSKQGIPSRKRFESGGVILRPESCNSEPTFTISSTLKVEAMTLKDGKTLEDVFKENESISNLKEALIKSAKECAERLKALAEIELQNQNHKPT